MNPTQNSSLPPPPSHAQYPQSQQHSQNGYGYDPSHNYGVSGGPSQSSLAGSSMGGAGYAGGDPFNNSAYLAYSSRNQSDNLGVVNPNEIADDGDDGLNYHRSQRNSMLSLPHSDRGRRQAAATTAAVGGGAAAGGLLGGRGGSYEMGPGSGHEKPSDWMAKDKKKSKKWKWVVIILVFLVIIGAIAGGVVGGMLNNRRGGGGGGSSSSAGDSADEDDAKNGELNKNSDEIKKLLGNKNLHRVFPGMDYTPINTQYPYCVHDPPSQNNVTRDIAVLSQLTNKIRLYGTDCNQTQMVIEAIKRLGLDDIKIWMGVWLDDNSTTNNRQLEQMWTILDDYGEDPFEGVIVANEILFRKEMTITTLASTLDEVRRNISDRDMKLSVATSDLGDDWDSELASDSDYIMANIHPFFAGVEADKAAEWTYHFWETQNKPFWKSDNKKNIISETGWPSGGGTHCGSATTCTTGAEAGIDGLNTFMEDWVCQALSNGTNYFWFSAFDEPWKERYNEKGKEWEDKWGLMTVDRDLKTGVKIPDCNGKTIKDQKDFA